jgi:integrase
MRTNYILQKQLDLVLALLGPVNRTVCQVMLHTGLRVGDVLTIRKDQLGRRMTVRESKTNKVKRCGLPDWLADEIRAQAGASEWAFPSPYDPTKHRTRQAVWKDIKRIAKVVRIPVNIGTHSMRKVYAVDLMRRYGDIAAVQRALNHDNPTVTILYALADQLAQSAELRRSVKPRR